MYEGCVLSDHSLLAGVIQRRVALLSESYPLLWRHSYVSCINLMQLVAHEFNVHVCSLGAGSQPVTLKKRSAKLPGIGWLKTPVYISWKSDGF